MESLEVQIENLFKAPLKQRNQLIDALFYDVSALDADEQAALSPLVDLKGTIIVVPPRAEKQRGGRVLRHYPNSLRFMLKEGDTIQAFVVAGVGSSVLGTAALARNVADHYGFDVAGVVTGYGLADVLEEALGGWFFYSTIDRARYEMQRALQQVLTPMPEAPASPPEDRSLSDFGPTPLPSTVLGNSDVGALRDILFAGPPNLRLLVGHSKGNLLLSFVLNHLKDELAGMRDDLHSRSHPLLDGNLAVVTLGAVVDIPTDTFKLRTTQFLGQYDLLGRINSNQEGPLGPIAPHTTVPRAGHHLNPRIPYAVSIADVLRDVPLSGHPAEAEGASRRLHSWGEWSSGTRERGAEPAGTR
jgi:hypothetical protein